MAQAPIVVQGHGANPPDALDRLRHRIPDHVPASLSEKVFNVPTEYSADPLVLVGRDALKAGREAAEKALTISHTTLADESETLHKRHMLARERVFNATKGAVDKAQKAIERIHDKVQALDQHLLGPAAPTNAVQMLAVIEARRALAAMPNAERRKAILAGIESGDLVTCVAATRCPGYLLNVSDIEISDYANEWGKRHAAEPMEQRRVLRQVLEHVERGGQLLLSFTTSLSSTQIAEEARKLAQRAQQAVAEAGVS